MYLISSFDNSACSSNSKGGVLDLDNSITFFTIISISPVCKFLLLCPSGLFLTIHSTVITYSDLNILAVSHDVLSSSGSKTT
ncbi:MAG: hypothetical protein Q8S84_03185 [bacterium]|nr:hypothetical protein [bacterium]